ncbi:MULTISPECIES: xanthine dehydrogenase accessory protein XdhC [Marivita]|uniref:Xanthine dehydrogenase accessory protein XdhC n=1 Tax=Marivita cryptomonadis TaxID=505252 RepID=A0A9Q2S1H1_9RHOB|nr:MULTISPECIES: xanthine dehydrogenase accessory protein XdhC [Marivita]MCR9169849.1 xanthine dehydrogenase accessory protein XdhC [Paracoccaceae bacterium]MBM2323494.1 xanthine dehydrogenase accessory protein XdhC [Marivita cryptomonadis]MBM2333080.1 xanthine dehydrogenase accessory protein XdhC [Marivita cryptomonadis]MBM2342660.1 xanthine dehydrogenase accessory protein XdhC [Marivita cryptomonadis]MBM2347328.1 xanthine dehydrogenase accessory protein XdhC [Marivita cryptomonadis]
MAFDLTSLHAAIAAHGQVARVVIAEVQGSSPREVGAAMLVWDGGQSGTIGGGALEYQAAQQAFSREGFSRHPLGPELGQCCGGAVTLLTEIYDANRLATLDGETVIARGPSEMPLAVKRLTTCARNQGVDLRPRMVQGWFVEPVAQPTTPLWIWGAGHVGRALVDVLHPVPEIEITWVDTAPNRFPDTIPERVNALPASDPLRVVPHAPGNAAHLILTYSHALDLSLCDALMRHGFEFAGLIGSDTKWARFTSRLRKMGHPDAQISRICCPIGQKSLGKHPQAIAVGVAAQLLSLSTTKAGALCPTTSFAFQA